MISEAKMGRHAYLATKGFPGSQGLVFNGMLLVPMRDPRGNLHSIQTIAADGEKKFLAGGKAKGCVFVIGTGTETYYCEGYATGLSVRAALSSLYRQARVVVCFSAANLAHVADRGFVIADNDESGTGQRYAEKTGLPSWMPPSAGDANDYHLSQGVRALALAINNLRRA
jgi:putative DNA primase/helicase